MRTVMDVIQENPGASVVLVQRHEDYLMEPLLARCPDQIEAYSRNYAQLEHPSMFLLTFEGIKRTHEQGRKLAQAGIQVEKVIGSEQGRGPDTGLRICEGYAMECGTWIPFTTNSAMNMTKYEYQPMYDGLKTIGDPVVMQWMNGQHQDMTRADTPESFKARVMGFVNEQLAKPGVCIITTHFEIVTLVHAIKVEHRDLGTVREDWSPKKGGGVITVHKPDESEEAFVYSPDFSIVE
ncbi:MAG: hypothetical protein HYW81_03440 [Parcubacteria group bacterium]|nr:hypothetical protein [Parcubacteria group bacterium]